MKVISPILPKIGCHGNVPWGIKKLVQIDNIHANTGYREERRHLGIELLAIVFPQL